MTYTTNPNVCIIDPSRFANDKMYDNLKATLLKSGVNLSLSNNAMIAMNDFDFILLTDPVKDQNFSPTDKVLGLRMLNRKERLEIAASLCEQLLPRWGAPKNKNEFFDLIKAWEAKYIVLKYDGYVGKKNIYLLPTENIKFPTDFDPAKDVIMELLDDDPFTYKVDVFSGNVLGSYVRKASVFQEMFPGSGDSLPPCPFSLPAEIAKELKLISFELLKYGVGYASIDMMKHKGIFKIIEINIHGIGRNLPWSLSFEQYAASYHKAILDTLKHIERIPRYGQLNIKHKPVSP